MKKSEYLSMEQYMLESAADSAHDPYHSYRVLYAALEIAKREQAVDRDILITVCLLHDIGRGEQVRNPAVNHAEAGSHMAYEYLLNRGWEESRAAWVRDCIAAHSYRKGQVPATIEGKILFDVDKLDVTGAMGIARTLLYGGQTQEPLYLLDDGGEILMNPTNDEKTTFFQEYHYKLKNLYGHFYTARAEELAANRQKAAVHFYESLHNEICSFKESGEILLRQASGEMIDE